MNLSEYSAKALGGGTVAVGGWIASTVESVPGWLREFGLPLVMLAGAIFAVVFLYKELAKERAARISDRDAFIARMEKEGEKGEASRAELLRATYDQTGVMRGLVSEMRKAGIHKPKSDDE